MKYNHLIFLLGIITFTGCSNPNGNNTVSNLHSENDVYSQFESIINESPLPISGINDSVRLKFNNKNINSEFKLKGNVSEIHLDYFGVKTKEENGVDTVWKVPGNCRSYYFDDNEYLYYQTNHFESDTLAKFYYNYNGNNKIINIQSENKDSIFSNRFYLYDSTYNLLIKEYCKLEHEVKLYTYDSLGRLSIQVNYRLNYLNNSPRIDTINYTYEYELNSTNCICQYHTQRIRYVVFSI